MNGVPSVCWVVALKVEAKSIIDELELTPLKMRTNFPVYCNKEESNWLIVSGVGQNHVTAATDYLREISNADSWSAWINVGIAGYGHDNYGALYMIDKVTVETSKIVLYPGVTLLTGLPRAGLLTVNKPKLDYSGQDLIDMEGFSFYETASKFTCRELLAILKVVSDGPKSDVRALSSEKIFKLISTNIKEILALGSKLENSSKAEFKRVIPPNICDQIKKTWHFTVSQEHQLNMLVRRWLAVFPESTLLSTIKDEKNSKSVIALLSISLGKHEVDWDLT